MIRDLYADQLDDFGKPVRGGYDMQRTAPTPPPPPVESKPEPPPVEKSAEPKTFAEAAEKAWGMKKPQPRKSAEAQAVQPEGPSDAQIESVAKQMKQTPDFVRKMMQSDPNFAKQIGETEIKGEKKPKQSQPEPPEPPKPQAPTPPPVESVVQESLAIGPDNFLADYGQRAAGQDAQLEDHLERAGIFDQATPQQLSQFAKMLQIPQYRFVSTPEQLRGAIFLNNAQGNLRQVLTNAGIIDAPTRGERLAEATGRTLGDFAGGFVEKSGIKPLANVAGAVRRAAKTGRFAATAEDDAPAQSWDSMTPLERAMYEDEDDYNAQQTYGKKEVDRLQAEKPGIEMPTQEIDNKDADQGDQLGLFEGTGKKNAKSKKFKLEKEKGEAKQAVMFDRMNDHPDQKGLFSTFGEAVEQYQADLKKK